MTLQEYDWCSDCEREMDRDTDYCPECGKAMP
jgi:RNA polymerase subunit RPABC4/transcription elongation factor Spt4